MNSRPIAAAFFVVFCLLLCGMILHRQIAGHPLPLRDGRQGRFEAGGGQPRFGFDFADWKPAEPAITKQAQNAVQGQISALQDGDAVKFLSYQSRQVQQQFINPHEFMGMIEARYPEFKGGRLIEPGPVLMDKTKQQARAFIMLIDVKHRRAFHCMFF